MTSWCPNAWSFPHMVAGLKTSKPGGVNIYLKADQKLQSPVYSQRIHTSSKHLHQHVFSKYVEETCRE